MSRAMKRVPLLLLALLSVLSVGCGDLTNIFLEGSLQSVAANSVRCSSDETIREMFETANAACPTRIDQFTTLESIEMLDDRRAVFRYRVNHQGKRLANRFNKRDLKAAVVKQLLGNPMAVAIAERDMSIEHIYEDSAGNHLLSFTINKQVLDGNPYPVGEQRENPFGVTTVRSSAEHQVVREPHRQDRNGPLSDRRENEGPANHTDATEQAVEPNATSSAEPKIKSSAESTTKTHEKVSGNDHSKSLAEGRSATEKESKPPRSTDEMIDRLETLMNQRTGQSPELPEEFRPRRTRDNPAGVRENPYFQ